MIAYSLNSWLACRTKRTLNDNFIFFFLKKTPDCTECPNQGNAGFWVVQKPKAKKSILPVLTVLKEMVNVELFVDAKFVLFGLSVFFGILGLYVPYAYLPALAIDCIGKDPVTGNYILSKERANLLLSIIGKCLISPWSSPFYFRIFLFRYQIFESFFFCH